MTLKESGELTGKGFIPNVSNHNKPNNGFIKISGRGWNNRDPTKNKDQYNKKKLSLLYLKMKTTKRPTWLIQQYTLPKQ